MNEATEAEIRADAVREYVSRTRSAVARKRWEKVVTRAGRRAETSLPTYASLASRKGIEAADLWLRGAFPDEADALLASPRFSRYRPGSQV